MSTSTAQTVADYKGLAYTVIITDGQDMADFLDIREVAFGEPGDETLVARIKVGGWTATDANLAVHVFFTVKGVAFRSGMNGAAAPSSTHPWDGGCKKDGTTAYCVMTYEKMKAEAGDKITATYSISYAGVAQDYAPGGHFAPDGVLGPKGKDYTLTGGPAKTIEKALPNITVEVPPQVESENGVATGVLTILNGATDNDTVNLTLENLPEGWTAAVVDEEGAETSSVTIAPGGNATLSFSLTTDGTEGNYSIGFNLTSTLGFNATYTVSVIVPAVTTVPTAAATESANTTSNASAAAATDSEGTIPAPHGLMAALLLAAVGIAIRRRRAD